MEGMDNASGVASINAFLLLLVEQHFTEVVYTIKIYSYQEKTKIAFLKKIIVQVTATFSDKFSFSSQQELDCQCLFRQSGECIRKNICF